MFRNADDKETKKTILQIEQLKKLLYSTKKLKSEIEAIKGKLFGQLS